MSYGRSSRSQNGLAWEYFLSRFLSILEYLLIFRHKGAFPLILRFRRVTLWAFLLFSPWEQLLRWSYFFLTSFLLCRDPFFFSFPSPLRKMEFRNSCPITLRFRIMTFLAQEANELSLVGQSTLFSMGVIPSSAPKCLSWA